MSDSNGDKVLKNKPKASKLRQQKLPAWQPILTANTVIPTVFVVGIVFIPVGIALFLASESVKEYKIDYTDCGIPGPLASCMLSLNITEPMDGDVYIYYYLENFYQNHRRYVKSRNDKQYLGDVNSVDECAPFDYITDASGTKKPIAPCGAIANSMFNDTFTIMNSALVKVPVTDEGILWDVDKNKKFKNPPHAPGQLCTAFANTAPPPNWVNRPRPFCDDRGFENPDFIVWMRTAALPNFRKLWRLLDRSATPEYANGLPAGTYQIQVANNFPVTAFDGRKGIIISTTSWAGGKNSFLGIAYMVVGSIALVLAVIFLIIHIKFGHSVNELSNISAAANN